MKTEELLKNIKNLLNKHADFLNNNPEIFFAIEDRLLKAVDPEDEDEDYRDKRLSSDDYGADEDGDYDLGFDDPESEDYSEDEDAQYVSGDAEDEEDAEAEKWLRENDPNYGAEESTDEGDSWQSEDIPEEDVEPVKQPEKTPEKKSSSRMVDWKARDKYEPHHDVAIKDYMKQGYSHREAERLAGAHQAPTNFYDALRSSTRPSEPSAKMLEHMKSLSHGWLRDAERKAAESAEADINPQKYASGKSLAAHDAAHKDFSNAYNDFLNSDEVKGLSGRARHQAVQAWKNKWAESNPEHRDAAISAASSGKALAEAGEARAKRLKEGEASILTAGFSSGEDSPMTGEFSSNIAGEQTGSAAAQSVGGEKDEDGGYSVSIKKDPNLVFSQQNPEYVKQLKSKLATKLAPEQTQRMSAVDSFKKPKE